MIVFAAPPQAHGAEKSVRARLYFFESWPYQMPAILTSFGSFEPRSVSLGWIVSKTPAISFVSLFTRAIDHTPAPAATASDAQ
jgi:hypothetical protein